MINRKNITLSFRRSESYVFMSTKLAKSFCDDPRLEFNFSPQDADDENSKFSIKYVGNLNSLRPSSLSLERHGKIVHIFADYIFQVEVNENCNCDQFDDWAQECGGWSTAFFEPIEDWEPNEDFEGQTYFGTRDEYGFPLPGNESEGDFIVPSFE